MIEENSLISIIVPVYKVEKYLRRCVDSILAQSYQNIEILLIDDDSPDNCPQICDTYARDYQNITSIHLKNSGIGVSLARNTGLENAKGEFIAFVDSDDFIHRDLFSNLINLFEQYSNINIAMASYLKTTGDSQFVESSFTATDVKFLDDVGAMKLIIDDQNMTAVWSKLFRKSVFENLRFPVGKHNEDMFLMPFIFKKARNIAYISQPLYYYYQANESLCRSTFNYNMLDMLDALSLWNKHVSLEYPSLINVAKSHYFNTAINICQYLANKTDHFGKEKFNFFQTKINSEFTDLIKSDFISINNKIKIVLFKIRLFKPVFKVIHSLNILRYD